MKTIKELVKEMNVEETVNTYGHKVRAQGRWARLKIKKQASKVEEILEVPQTQIRKLTTDLQHDVEALKKFYQTQKREISKLTKTLKRNKDKFIEKSKVFSGSKGHDNVHSRKEKVVRDTEVA